MARTINYDLRDPGLTIYHRAAMGGLAATLTALEGDTIPGVSFTVEKTSIRLTLEGDEVAALTALLAQSFRVTSEGMIDLPGLRIPPDRHDLRLAVHNGLTQSFLQHPKMRPGPKGTATQAIQTADGEGFALITYKPVSRYAHQTGQGTDLLDAKSWRTGRATLPQSVVPGAMAGALPLECEPEAALLLLYLVVACPVFLLRNRKYGERVQCAVIVPDVLDLQQFTKSLERLVGKTGPPRFSNTYLGRVVGGAEEAALRFLVDIKAAGVEKSRGMGMCLVIAMGKVSWDKNQVNRSLTARVSDAHREMDVYRTANEWLGGTRLLKTQKGDGFAVPASPIPELVAANLVAGRDWYDHFAELVSDKKDFGSMRFAQKGLSAMKAAMTDETDSIVVQAFHDAWRLKMNALFKRAREEKLDASRLVELERERIRNAILRAKTSEQLASWFLQFAADAQRTGSLKTMRESAPVMHEFLFNARNFSRFQNLCLFALVSYAATPKAAEPDTDDRQEND